MSDWLAKSKENSKYKEYRVEHIKHEKNKIIKDLRKNTGEY